MVAKIKSGKSLTGALRYNEDKVKQGKAVLIAAVGYARDQEALTFYDKLFRLEDLAGRNLRTKTNTVHLSLNFDVSETLAPAQLILISEAYMKGIGFEGQPYLIYNHSDAGHPHIHIVTTNIRADGQRIGLHGIGKLRSEPVRKAIEEKYGLVQAGRDKGTKPDLPRTHLQPLTYGSTDLKRELSGIVNDISRTYKYTSLPELNAVLNLYNVTADRGGQATVMYKHGGLQYWALDDRGQKLGVPLKASKLYLKPTLKHLNKQIELNTYLRKPFGEKLKSKIDRSLSRSSSMKHFLRTLAKENVIVVERRNPEGRLYGLTYVDRAEKAVFNGSDLGKSYSAAAIAREFSPSVVTTPGNDDYQRANLAADQDNRQSSHPGNSLLDELLNPYEQYTPTPSPPRGRKKKRRKLNL